MNNILRRTLGASVAGALVFGLAFLPSFAGAAQFKAGEQPALSHGEQVNDDLYMAGGTVTSAGEVAGDLIVAGGNIVVSGPVAGDVSIGGGSVTVLGSVGDDLRIGGGNITIAAGVVGDVVVGGGTVSINGAGINGDLAAVGGVVAVNAPVTGSVKIRGGEVTINSTVLGDVDIKAEKVRLGENAIIHGNLVYRATEEASVADGAQIEGTVDFTDADAAREGKGSAVGAGVIGAVIAVVSLILVVKFVAVFLVSLFFAYFFRRYSHELVARAAAKPWGEIGRGLVVAIVLPVVSMFLFMTLIGIPLGLLGILVFALLAIFTSFIMPIVAGSLVHKWIWKPAAYVVNWKTVLLGAVVILILGIIPFIGTLANVILFFLTLGVMIGLKWELAREWR